VSSYGLSQQTPTFRRFYGVIFQQPLYCNWAAHRTQSISLRAGIALDARGIAARLPVGTSSQTRSLVHPAS